MGFSLSLSSIPTFATDIAPAIIGSGPLTGGGQYPSVDSTGRRFLVPFNISIASTSPGMVIAGPGVDPNNPDPISKIPAGEDRSLSKEPTEILATYKPNFGLSLEDAATYAGYKSFNWVQTWIVPDPNPFLKCWDPWCFIKVHLTNSTIAVNDPPNEYGYTYCNPNVPGNISWVLDCTNRYPYYYPVDAAADTCIRVVLVAPDTFLLDCTVRLQPNDSALNFWDAPQDSCLLDKDGNQSPNWNAVTCNNTNAKQFSYLAFTTQLVGVRDGQDYDPLPAWFAWIDTFNGASGGLTSTPEKIFPVDPGSGSGGITITSVNGIPVASVPEPSGMTIFLGIIYLSVIQRIKKRTQF
jgi:hypothetical protein